MTKVWGEVSEWHEVGEVGGRAWSAWRVEVCLGKMPDGTVAPTGLRIEPRDDYEGSIRDQRITLQRLRQFPLGGATTSARIRSLGEEQTQETFALIDQLLEEQLTRSRVVLTQLEIETLERELRDSEERIAAREAEIRQKYRDRGWSDRKIQLHEAAFHYRLGQRNPAVPSPRRYVAEMLGISVTTVDRLLREARKLGYLPPYDGGQGKHGKSPSEAQQMSTEGVQKVKKAPRRPNRAPAKGTSAAPRKKTETQRKAN